MNPRTRAPLPEGIRSAVAQQVLVAYEEWETARSERVAALVAGAFPDPEFPDGLRIVLPNEEFDALNRECTLPPGFQRDVEPVEVQVFAWARLTAVRFDPLPDGSPACRVCGCWDERACPGGCYWVEDDLCSSCVGKEAPGARS